MHDFIKIVGNGRKTARDMTSVEATQAMTQIMEGQATPVQIAAFMAALRIKEETSEELAAFTAVLRCYCHIERVNRPELIDLCIPYDGRTKSLSLTPAAACIAAAGGAAVAMHGRLGSVTPPKFGYGVGDILAALGVDVDLPLGAAAESLAKPELGLAFVSTWRFAPALEQFNSLRLEYGLRSFLNSIEKMLNPFGATTSLVGVFHQLVLHKIAAALQSQNYQKGLAVHGPEGSIDVTSTRLTKIVESRQEWAEPQTWVIDPTEYGLRSKNEAAESDEDSPALTPQQNAALTIELLQPETMRPNPELTSYRRSALLSAALLLYAANQVSDISAGLQLAQELINSGEALARLERWKKNFPAKSAIFLMPILNKQGVARER